MMGGVIAVGGNIMSSQATSVEMLMVSNGLVTGELESHFFARCMQLRH